VETDSDHMDDVEWAVILWRFDAMMNQKLLVCDSAECMLLWLLNLMSSCVVVITCQYVSLWITGVGCQVMSLARCTMLQCLIVNQIEIVNISFGCYQFADLSLVVINLSLFVWYYSMSMDCKQFIFVPDLSYPFPPESDDFPSALVRFRTPAYPDPTPVPECFQPGPRFRWENAGAEMGKGLSRPFPSVFIATGRSRTKPARRGQEFGMATGLGPRGVTVPPVCLPPAPNARATSDVIDRPEFARIKMDSCGDPCSKSNCKSL
jgi:hypothetical protein